MINNEVSGIETKRVIDPEVGWGQAGIEDTVIVAYGWVSKAGSIRYHLAMLGRVCQTCTTQESSKGQIG